MQRRNSDSTQNVFGEDNESKSQASSLDSEEPAKGRFMVSWNKTHCNVVQKIVLTYIEFCDKQFIQTILKKISQWLFGLYT